MIIHNSIQNNKEILNDVNKNWLCDLLTFSPTIEAGIDFNVTNYFDKCYVMISFGSTTPRGLNQMMNRIRQYNDNNVLCYIGKMKWKTNDLLMRYDEMRLNKYKNIVLSNLVKVLIHNDVEKYNSTNFFITVMTQMITDKGNTYEYLDDKTKMKITKDEITRENIVMAINIDDFTFETLLHKQKTDEELTIDENYQIEKHIYKKKWIVEDITPEFIDINYRKTHIIKNNFIINEDKETLLNTEYFKQIKYDKKDKIKELINNLGFNILNYKIDKTNDINQETFKQKTKEFFTSKYNKTLFGINKEIKEKNHLEIVNETLNNYG